MSEQELLLADLLQEQRRTNKLLMALIEALSDDDHDDQPTRNYLDGSPV